MERYTLNFGRSNAGAVASFTTFARLDTLAALTQPAIVEISDGWFYFEYDASLAPEGVTQVMYTAICGTGEASAVFTVAAAAGAGGTPGATGTGIAASAPTPYELFFGTTLAGNAPAFVRFARADTHAALTAPNITEIGNGLYQFIVDWASQTTTSIEYVVSCAGVELADVIQGAPAAGTVGVAVGTANWTGFATVAALLNRVAVQCGLSTVADPYASSDPDFILMRDLLVSVGDDILQEHDWTHLVLTGTILTNGSTTSYVMPASYKRMVPRTAWNRSTRLPALGPLSRQQSAALQASIMTIVVDVVFQMQGGVMFFPVVPPNGATIAWDFESRYWIKSSGGTAPDRAEPAAADDLLLFDPELLLAGVRLRFLEIRGFDTTVAATRYAEQLEAAIGENIGGGQALNLSGPRAVIGPRAPEGNWPV